MRAASDHARQFYDEFFKNLIFNMGQKLTDREYRETVVEEVEKFFGKRELSFVAVDGSCHRHKSNEFISFYGGAYGAKGILSLSEGDATVEYKRWEIEKDVSMVAFVPVPYSRLSEVGSDGVDPMDHFATRETDKIELSSIHLPIMQLAEVFLAYNTATSSNLDRPDIILVDNSISGMLGYTDFSPDSVRLIGCRLADGRIMKKQDAAVVQAHPFGTDMGVPSTKKFSRRFAVIKFFHDNQGADEIPILQVSKSVGIDNPDVLRGIMQRLSSDGIIDFDVSNDTVKIRTDPYKSWEQTKTMFQGICKAIFLDKRVGALKYEASDGNGKPVVRWMAPDDVRFLIAVGLRALIEECWSKKILLVGIAKDSASSYLTKNYLGVCRHFGKYQELPRSFGSLPPTDRMFCEILPYVDDNILSPWGTIEFDSTFMTLRTEIRDGREIFGGTFSGITRPERLFMRSVAQFYTRRNTESPLTGHAIFIDRLTFPEWDGNASVLEVSSHELGEMRPLFYPTSRVQNVGQIVTYFLLDTLTKNHFAEMIGYPDPLHKADQGAKSMRDSVRKLLDSSEIKFRSRPLINTLREIRSRFGR